MLATDVNNPDFMGAVSNPDALLYVEFYWHEPIDKWASDEQSLAAGKRVTVKGQKMPYVRIMKPGDQLSIVEVPVREDHKRRWPEKWLYWQMAEGLIDDGQNIPGWKLEEWSHLDEKPDFLRELKFLRFHTVEQVAGASDSQLQKIGMAGPGLREQARVDLRNKMGAEVREQLALKDKEISDMKKRMDDMAATLATLKPDKTLHVKHG